MSILGKVTSPHWGISLRSTYFKTSALKMLATQQLKICVQQFRDGHPCSKPQLCFKRQLPLYHRLLETH